ncbi:MAG: hypothetical protein JO316_02780 [Abitibacteriaceae bacterium]|nr:hypothetical protein [Abditibacteriaceae bacterium]
MTTDRLYGDHKGDIHFVTRNGDNKCISEDIDLMKDLVNVCKKHLKRPVLPLNIELPFFTYGLFKPGELAYKFIEPLLEAAALRCSTTGGLAIRDGLPLLDKQGTRTVVGYLLYFRQDSLCQAYEKISDFEPQQLYKWDEIDIAQSKIRANVLVGKDTRTATVHYDKAEWTGREDPVLNEGLEVVKHMIEEHGSQRFEPGADMGDWSRFFHLQMAYLLLWTAIERYAALCYSPTLEPGEKVKCLGDDRLCLKINFCPKIE